MWGGGKKEKKRTGPHRKEKDRMSTPQNGTQSRFVTKPFPRADGAGDLTRPCVDGRPLEAKNGTARGRASLKEKPRPEFRGAEERYHRVSASSVGEHNKLIT